MPFRLSSFAICLLAAAQMGWVSFQDPVESAFTLDVPQGWTAKGGLFRMGYSDARPMVDIQSPDGRIDVRLRDVAIPSYFVPNQLHPREGEIYDLGAQAQLTVARYRSAQEYVGLYAESRGSRASAPCSCGNPPRHPRRSVIFCRTTQLPFVLPRRRPPIAVIPVRDRAWPSSTRERRCTRDSGKSRRSPVSSRRPVRWPSRERFFSTLRNRFG